MKRDKMTLIAMRNAPVGAMCQVRNLPESHKLRFAWNVDDVTPIKADYANASGFDCFYYELTPKGDNYGHIWGMVGSFSHDYKAVTKIF